MIESASRNWLRAQLFTARIMHGALCASVLIYGAVLYAVMNMQGPAQQSPGDGRVFEIAFGVVAAVILLAIPLVRSRMLPPRGTIPHVDEEFPDPLPAAAKQAMARLFTAFILSMALAESIAIFGLIVGFFTHRVRPFYPFAGVSLLVMFALRPRRAQFEAAVWGALE